MREQPTLGPGDARTIVIWSGCLTAAVVFTVSLLAFDATWFEAIGLGILFGAACALGTYRATMRLPRRS